MLPSHKALATSGLKAFNCSDLQEDYSVTGEQLITWNPWLASDCDTNLYADLAEYDKRSVCIGVNATAPHGTMTELPSSTLSQPATSTTAAMGPTQSDTLSGCVKFYTVSSGDTCYNIETTNGITLDQFFDWNPSG